MARFLKALILLPLALIVILLAVANRTPVFLSLDPLAQTEPDLSIQLPLFVVIFATLAIGILIGGTATWLAQGRYRRERRQFRREAEILRNNGERPSAPRIEEKPPQSPVGFLVF